MPRYLIGLGTSHPDGVGFIQRAYLMLERSAFIHVVAAADLEIGQAMGGTTDFTFTNSALAISTSLHSDTLWLHLRSIEQKLGRCRLFKNGPRTIDLDILWCIEHTFDSCFLKVPHPEFLNRSWAMKPAVQAARKAKWPIPLWGYRP